MENEDSKTITVKLRVSPELKQKIVESAEKHNRSMNADMVARLEKSFEDSEAVEKKYNALMIEFAQLFMEMQKSQAELISFKDSVQELVNQGRDK